MTGCQSQGSSVSECKDRIYASTASKLRSLIDLRAEAKDRLDAGEISQEVFNDYYVLPLQDFQSEIEDRIRACTSD